MSWTCPYCNQIATITDHNQSSFINQFHKGYKYGTSNLNTNVIVCPNDKCNEVTISASLRSLNEKIHGKYNWQLKPFSKAKVFPDYVPAAIIQDYEEACLIKDLSPKASATLSRRCIQGMIRDFWGISKKHLYLEINELEGKVDEVTWQAIDSVRKIGNIGAHMETDINLIIDVEPNEASLLVELIETLISEWYVARNQREERMKRIVAIAEDKKDKKSQ